VVFRERTPEWHIVTFVGSRDGGVSYTRPRICLVHPVAFPAGARGERMAGDLHLNGPQDHSKVGSGEPQVALIRLNAPAASPSQPSPFLDSSAPSRRTRRTSQLGGKVVSNGQVKISRRRSFSMLLGVTTPKIRNRTLTVSDL
jgi:hypothetical protein